MYDLVLALAFVGMIILPAIVATNSKSEHDDDV